MASNARRYGPVRAKVASNARRYGGYRREAAKRRPLRREGPILSLRASAHTGVAIRNPVPFFNVFKWQFENSTIFNFQFSIFNSPGRAAMAVNDRRYGRTRAGACGGQ